MLHGVYQQHIEQLKNKAQTANHKIQTRSLSAHLSNRANNRRKLHHGRLCGRPIQLRRTILRKTRYNYGIRIFKEGGDLGKLFKRKAASGGGGGGGGAKKGIFKKLSQPPGSDGGKKGGKLKNFIHKALHVTNRVNPATALIRSGVLISMKLNLFKVAQRLKFAYLTDEQARQKEVDMSKFDRLKKVKEKLEKIFYDAGGKPENLKKAILTGKGNKNLGGQQH